MYPAPNSPREEHNKYWREYVEQQAFPGWKSLIMPILDMVDVEPNAQILQIKEKFGGLRFYATGSDSLQAAISEAEDQSYKICMDCGQPGTQTTKWNGRGRWILTLCPACVKERRHLTAIELRDYRKKYPACPECHRRYHEATCSRATNRSDK